MCCFPFLMSLYGINCLYWVGERFLICHCSLRQTFFLSNLSYDLKLDLLLSFEFLLSGDSSFAYFYLLCKVSIFIIYSPFKFTIHEYLWAK